MRLKVKQKVLSKEIKQMQPVAKESDAEEGKDDGGETKRDPQQEQVVDKLDHVKLLKENGWDKLITDNLKLMID